MTNDELIELIEYLLQAISSMPISTHEFIGEDGARLLAKYRGEDLDEDDEEFEEFEEFNEED